MNFLPNAKRCIYMSPGEEYVLYCMDRTGQGFLVEEGIACASLRICATLPNLIL